MSTWFIQPATSLKTFSLSVPRFGSASPGGDIQYGPRVGDHRGYVEYGMPCSRNILRADFPSDVVPALRLPLIGQRRRYSMDHGTAVLPGLAGHGHILWDRVIKTSMATRNSAQTCFQRWAALPRSQIFNLKWIRNWAPLCYLYPPPPDPCLSLSLFSPPDKPLFSYFAVICIQSHLNSGSP
jgi:hypothetical protein